MSEERLPQAFGPYLLLDRLGAGGMGTLHLARPIRAREGGSILVVKRLPPAATEDAERLARFKHEAEIAVSVKSDHVVQVFEAGAVEKTPFIAMEHVLGSTLGAIANVCRKRGSALSIPVLVRLFADVLDGLQSLHDAIHPATGVPLGVVHRDISPGNVMIAEDRSLLIDLGLGRSNVQTWRTRTGLLMGTPGYIAPEQARGERTDARTDLYGVAVLLWEAITLEHYVPRGELAKMVEVMCDPEPRWQASRTAAPERFDALLRKAMSPEPAHRFESARELRDAMLEASPIASQTELVAAIPELTAGWRERQQSIERLLASASDADAEEQETKLYATRAVAITVPPTFVQTDKRSPILFAALFAVVTSAAATATALLVGATEEPAEVRVVEQPAIVPRPEVTPLEKTVEKVEPIIEKRIERIDKVERMRPIVEAPPATPPPPPRSLAELREDLIRMAAGARRMRKEGDPRAAEVLARINRLLALPSLEGHEQEIEDLALGIH